METMEDDSLEQKEGEMEENDIEIEPDIVRTSGNILTFVIILGVVVLMGIIVGVKMYKKKSNTKNKFKEGDDN